MSTQVQYRRGSSVQVAAFTGALGELVIDTTNHVVVVNDGSTVGGFPQVGTTATQTLTNKTLSAAVLTGAATGTGSVSLTGNITGAYIFGNGSQLSGIDATSIQSGTSNVKVVSSGGNVAVSIGGTPNVAVYATTGEYVTGLISASGNVTGGNLTTDGNVVSAWSTPTTGMSTGGNVIVGGYISCVGNLYVANIVSSQTLTVDDPLLYLTANTPFPYNYSIGFYSAFVGGAGNTYQHTGLARDYTDGTWKLVSNVPEPSGSSINFTNAIYDPLKMGALTSTSTVSATGTITGGNLATGGTVSATGAITGASLTVGTGTITGGNIVNSNANGVGNIGSSTTYFNTVFAKATSAQYADLAEMYCADAAYTPGTLVEFGGEIEVTITSKSHSTAVAGIISTNPSYLMNSTLECDNAVAVALTGRVPCQVVGTIVKGDRLVASDRPGVATVLDINQYQPGCIIGKALENYNSLDVGVIEVAVGRT